MVEKQLASEKRVKRTCLASNQKESRTCSLPMLMHQIESFKCRPPEHLLVFRISKYGPPKHFLHRAPKKLETVSHKYVYRLHKCIEIGPGWSAGLRGCISEQVLCSDPHFWLSNLKASLSKMPPNPYPTLNDLSLFSLSNPNLTLIMTCLCSHCLTPT